MTMDEKKIGTLFEAYSGSLEETMNCHEGKAGFKVPEYQRNYNWDHGNIKRLLEDCLSRFATFCITTGPLEKSESYVFLGTTILVRVSNPPDEGFDGTSLIVVDGQQRITTLSLICCALIELIRDHREELDTLEEKTKSWLNEEIEHQLEILFTCVSGRLIRRNRPKPYPRIIRQNDSRSYDASKADYMSPIAIFLHEFATHYSQEDGPFAPDWEKNNEASQSLQKNYEYIQKQINYLYKGTESSLTSDAEYEFVRKAHFPDGPARVLFDKLAESFPNDDKDRAKNKACSDISKSQQSEGLVRLILFASYLTKNVVLTRVETRSEDYAFDIFDALNTTGEPLTALEAFKPQVVHFENNARRAGWSGPISKIDFDELEKYIIEKSKSAKSKSAQASSRQKLTKEILITFALYHDGTKLPAGLSNQRKYLKGRFSRLTSEEMKRNFVKSIYQIAEYQRYCWDTDGIEKLKLPATDITLDELESVKFCLAFIASTNTQLTIPILARYWNDADDSRQQDFAKAVKALAAFLALRRSATGDTRGIDDDFRSLMQDSPKAGGDPLCLGADHSNQLISVEDFKKELQRRLVSPRVGIADKDAWVKLASTKPLARRARHLCRFLIFAASHRADIDRANPGTLTQNDRRSDNNYLRYADWSDTTYQTIEHVAPDNPPDDYPDEWESVYRQLDTRDLVGNIVLLPSKINSSLGNSTWDKKRTCYNTLASETKTDFDTIVDEAVKQGTIGDKAGKKLKATWRDSPRLKMLDSVKSVKNWDKEFIERRTENILRLAWGTISPWLYN